MGREHPYIQCINERYPDLRIESARLVQGGQYNDVLEVNDDLIFRFARHPPAIETLQRETTILTHIQAYVTLAIPNPIYRNLETSTIGKAFIGYPKIRGETLWREPFHAIQGPATLDALAEQVTTFLEELHAIPVRDAIPICLEVAETREEWATLYGRIQERLFPYMRPDARQQVARHFEAYLKDPALPTFEPVLRHGDFGAGNLIYDPDGMRITGVIDFGFAGLGDAATDYAALLSAFGEPFFERCIKRYPKMAQALGRVRFYRGTFALYEALFGLEHGDAEAFKSGMAAYV